ncbi:hypothetical protein CBM2599_B50401 [Cupriavidus taiwanensis]|nr:hypothetical protein CBM2600_B10589 [Cupriavidus taiwanensis]SOY96469.1 hypothetical protein CBM2599_B50401 [Cupriavidus taiwanensis]
MNGCWGDRFIGRLKYGSDEGRLVAVGKS